jgi:hypothetical protein
MRIVDRATFLAMGQVLFSKYEPINFGELMIKTGSRMPVSSSDAGDFFATDITCTNIVNARNSNDVFDILSLAAEDSTMSIPLQFSDTTRDGLFDKDQKFAVWERQDVEALIDRLTLLLREMT